MRRTLLLPLSIVVAFTACDDNRQPLPLAPNLAVGGHAACPLAADVVVTDQASLVAALGAAVAGDVIGVDGVIELSSAVGVLTAGITLTCATAGSGLVAGAGFPSGYLLVVLA